MPKGQELVHEKPDARVLADLYDTHYEKVVRYITARIGNFAEAEDMASEVFLRALESFDKFQWRGIPIEAWLFRIAHNLVIDRQRRMKKRKDVPLETVLLEDTRSPEEEAQKALDLEEISKALDKLTEGQRQVLALRFGAGMTSEEAGKVLGKKDGAVREMQSHAIKSLRNLLSVGNETEAKRKA